MKDIPGFEGRYAVTEDGKVWSYLSNRFLKNRIGTHGYLIVELQHPNGSRRKGFRYVKSVHRLVAMTYIKNPKCLPFINHKDSNRLNAHISNLEWCTQKTNMEHAKSKGRMPRGENSKQAKLTEKDVLEIRGKYKFWKYTMPMLAEEYGVTFTCIQAVLSRRNWKHI